jgi:hypothetical protein
MVNHAKPYHSGTNIGLQYVTGIVLSEICIESNADVKPSLQLVDYSNLPGIVRCQRLDRISWRGKPRLS